MGFPVGYTEVFLPNIFLHALSLLSLLRALALLLLRLLGLADFLEADADSPRAHGGGGPEHHRPAPVPLSALLIRELLPVVKLGGDGAESCAVCLYEFEGGAEIRWLPNCMHIFHRGCLDRWMDHDRMTCPLCRTPFVPEEMKDEFNQRLWAAYGASDLYSEYDFAAVSDL